MLLFGLLEQIGEIIIKVDNASIESSYSLLIKASGKCLYEDVFLSKVSISTTWINLQILFKENFFGEELIYIHIDGP